MFASRIDAGCLHLANRVQESHLLSCKTLCMRACLHACAGARACVSYRWEDSRESLWTAVCMGLQSTQAVLQRFTHPMAPARRIASSRRELLDRWAGMGRRKPLDLGTVRVWMRRRAVSFDAQFREEGYRSMEASAALWKPARTAHLQRNSELPHPQLLYPLTRI